MVSLRSVDPSDLPLFFEHQLDSEARWMAAFTSPDPTDRDVFDRHWQRIMANDTINIRTVVVNDSVAGHVSSYLDDGRPEVTYWIGREFWGRGVATCALGLFLVEMTTRPVFARVASDNHGSIRVLQKNGFEMIDSSSGYANARSAEIPELLLRLD